MIILGVETSTRRTSVCLADRDGTLATAASSIPRAHAEFLAPALDFCLRAAGVTAGRVTGVAVGLGPGQYTGMRVGIAFAQAFAHARRLPVTGFSALDLLAVQVRWARPDRVVAAVIDARRGELFWAFYRPVGGGVQRIDDAVVGNVTRLCAEIQAIDADVLCVGEGARLHVAEIERTGAVVATADHGHPRASDLVALARPRFEREETQRPEELRPIYLREPDARIDWRARGVVLGTQREEGS